MFYNWYDPQTGAKLTAWPRERGRARHGLPVRLQRRQRLAGDGADRRRGRADRGCATQAQRAAGRAWTSASTTTRMRRSTARSAAASGSSRRPGARCPATTAAAAGPSTTPATTTARSTPSRGWPATSASRSSRSRRSTTSARGARSRDDAVTGRWSEQQPVGRVTGPTSVSPVFEGAYDYRGMQFVPDLGRLDVRGADGPACSSRRSSGARRAGRINHPTYVQAQIEHGMNEAELRLLGLLAVEQPGGWLPRVRRRPDRHGARRLHVGPGADHCRRGLRPRGRAGPAAAAADVVRRRCRDAARRRSSRCGTRRTRRWPTSRSCARTSTPTAPAASTTPSTSRPARWRSATSPSTRAWSWPLWATRSPATCLRKPFSQGRDGAAGRAADADGGVQRWLRPALRDGAARGRSRHRASSSRPRPTGTSGSARRTDAIGRGGVAGRPRPAVGAARDRRPRPGDARLVTGLRCAPATSCTPRTTRTGRSTPLDHDGNDVLAVPHPPYVDTTGEPGRAAVVRRRGAARGLDRPGR